MPESDYEQVIVEMLEYFKLKGYSKFYVKPHDADRSDWLSKLSQKYGVEIFDLLQSVPVESFASTLQCGVIVSICSSALLNLKLFGYRGHVVSFGIDKCSVKKSIRRAHEEAKTMYLKAGVQVIG